jgi:L-ascorbate metabolism protein UlaG (beta-lactamase superfamily)
MGQFTEKQEQINQRAVEAVADYPVLWSHMVTEWQRPGPEDLAWLMYSANYLLRTANVRWTIDPLRLKHKLADAPDMPVEDLKSLDFILLTHQHSDHLDLNLLHGLQDFPVLWVVPAFLLPVLQAEVDIAEERLIIPEPMRTFEIQGIRITPFNGLHWEPMPDSRPLRGVEAMGYLIEHHGKRWLFPGDTRTYDASQLPPFDSIDILFAHVWLGRGSALNDEPTLLHSFSRFCMDLRPKKIVLTHLYEFGRDANDCWGDEHVQQITSLMAETGPEISVTSGHLGDCIELTTPGHSAAVRGLLKE